MRYFFDTYAIIEIIRETKSYEKYGDEEIITSILNIGELYYILLREHGKETANYWYEKLKSIAIQVDIEAVIKAMNFRSAKKEKHLSFIDCVGYILAKEMGLEFLTGDGGFKGIENVQFEESNRW